MPAIDIVVQTDISRSIRCRQLETMFDVPAQKKHRLTWKGEIAIDEKEWNVGLIVGPSGCGKSTIAKQVFADDYNIVLDWGAESVVDDFSEDHTIEDISKVCQAVGFNTIPAWMRPHAVLSNGEKFRVDIARRLLELSDPIVVDEFTSIVDRQVAQIGAYAVQKYVRKNNRKFVGISCYHDVTEWLMPDWILQPASMEFSFGRSLQRRPEIEIEIRRVPFEVWGMFAPFHYLTAQMNKGARCFGLFANGELASFAGVIHRLHPRTDNIKGVSRLVTLPDWQGLGLAMVLVERLGEAYRALGKRLRTYPAHPALIRAFDNSPKWALKQKPGHGTRDTHVVRHKGQYKKRITSSNIAKDEGKRPCAVFEFSGDYQIERSEAQRLIG